MTEATRTVYVAREQDNEFRTYEEYTKTFACGSIVTVGDVRAEFATRLNIDHDMICLINGSPSADSTILQDEDKAYFKYPAKARG